MTKPGDPTWMHCDEEDRPTLLFPPNFWHPDRIGPTQMAELDQVAAAFDRTLTEYDTLCARVLIEERGEDPIQVWNTYYQIYSAYPHASLAGLLATAVLMLVDGRTGPWWPKTPTDNLS